MLPKTAFTAVDDTETRCPVIACSVWGTGITVTNKADKTLLICLLVADNVFLTRLYQSHLNRLKYFEYYQSSPNGRSGIYNMGRNISFRLTVPFKKKWCCRKIHATAATLATAFFIKYLLTSWLNIVHATLCNRLIRQKF